MNNAYTTKTEGNSTIIYEDSFCRANLVAADFRDECWYIGIDWVIDKRIDSRIKLSDKQKHELYKRISNSFKNELYTDEFKLISVDDEKNGSTEYYSLLEVEE